MAFQYPSQRIQDYLSQRWVMLCGRRIEPADQSWLMGPFGNVDVIADQYVGRLAADEHLQVERHTSGVGLLESADQFGLSETDRSRLRPQVAEFYERTADHDMEVWSEWNPFFCPAGSMLQVLYSRRLQQFNVPLRPLDTARGMRSEILKLRCTQTGCVKHTVWYRILKATGHVIYSGLYSTCRVPDGRWCVKVVFPLPRGNATVLMAISVGTNGELDLVSSGERFGDPGFYFVLRDSRGRTWAKYVRSFRERIKVYVDDEGVLRTDHLLTLWRLRVMELHYKLTPQRANAGVSVSEPVLSGDATQ